MLTQTEICNKYGIPDDIQALRKTLFKSIDLQFDREAIVYWFMNVYEPCKSCNIKIFRSWDNACAQFLSVDLRGYVIETLQTSVNIPHSPRVTYELLISDLKLIIPYVKKYTVECPPLQKFEGIVIGVTDCDLSYYGAHELHIDGDQYRFVICTRRRYRLIESFTSLDDSAKFIWDNITNVGR